MGVHVSEKLRYLVCLIALAAVMLASEVVAQTPAGIDMHIKRARELKHSTIPKNGEYKLSLGSQMFSEDAQNFILNQPQGQSRFMPDNNPAEEGNDSAAFSNSSSLRLRSLRGNSKRLSPVITLNNSYEDNAIGLNDSDASGLAITGGNRRLQVYGEYEQRQTPQLRPVYPETSRLATSLRASTISSTPGTDETNTYDRNSALASRYYLEAIYSFKPTIKGKVSFKRSMIDTFESEEKLQVEGIVDANSDIQIKAGYNNEVRPEITEPRSNNDTKVWTEFILKF